MHRDTYSLTDFRRNSKTHISRLKKTGVPEQLTVRGSAELVVQSVEAYEKLLHSANMFKALTLLRKSLDELKKGKSSKAS